MKKVVEEDMMNPKNWGLEEIKEAANATLLASCGILVCYIIVWLAY